MIWGIYSFVIAMYIEKKKILEFKSPVGINTNSVSIKLSRISNSSFPWD